MEAAGASVELEAGTRLDSITDPRSAARRARGLPETAANQTQTSDRAAGKTAAFRPLKITKATSELPIYSTKLTKLTLLPQVYGFYGWLSSQMVSMQDSVAEGPRFKSQSRRCRVTRLRQTVHTHYASVHQAARLVAALLRVAGVTAGLVESNGSLLPGL